MPGTTITISGDSNDSKVLLSSENSTIIETDASLSTLETSMNLLETSVETLERNIKEVDKLSLVNSHVNGTKNVAYTFTVGFNNMTTSQLESTLEAQRGYVDDSMRLGAVFVGFYWNSSYTICTGLFILPNNFSYTQKKVIIQTTWGTQLFTSANFNPSITRVYNYDNSSSEWSSWESNLGTDEVRSDVYSRLNTKITINDLQGMYHSVVPNFFPVEEKVTTLETSTNIGLLDGHFSLVINQVGVLFCDYFKLEDGVLKLRRYSPNANTTPSRIDMVWWLNTDNAKLEHEIPLIYVGKTSDGYEFTSEWNDNIHPTEKSNTLALKMDKIVLNPETLKNHAYDKEWLIKKTTTGWNAEKPSYLTFDANTTPLWPGNGGIDVSFTVYAEQTVTIDGVTGPRYQVQGIPLYTRFALIKLGRNYFPHNLINNLNKDVNKKVGTLETSMNSVETFLPTANWRFELRSLTAGDFIDTYVPYGSSIATFQNWHDEHNWRITLEPELIDEGNRVQNFLYGETFAPNRQTYSASTISNGIVTTAFKEAKFENSKFLERFVEDVWSDPTKGVLTPVTDVSTIEQNITINNKSIKMYITKPNDLSGSDNTCIVRVHGHYAFWSANSATIKQYREK